MQREIIRQTLKQLFEDETGKSVESLNDTDNLAKQYDLDSVDMVGLIMQVERSFRIRLKHEELASVETAGGLIDLIERRINTSGAA